MTLPPYQRLNSRKASVMSSDKAGDVLLVVENPNQLTSQEEAIRTRLITLLGCSVLVHGADASIPEGINLAVVCSGSASAGLRELAVPLLACPPSGCVSVLYDLGMTMAKPDTDFGALKYSSISIRPDALYHPLAGNLSDRIKISADRELQGWAKPGAAALVVASVGGDSTRAVIFAYCQGDLMPARESVHRRAAFLPAVPDGTAPKDDLLWRLFDAIVHWTVEGGGPVAPEGGAGLWFLKDGTPTRALSTQEYRDWVHEQVSAGVWKKIGAIFSVIGVGGLITISVILITAMNRTLHEGQVEQQRNLESKLDDKMKERAKAVFVELLYQDSPISKDVRNRLEADAARTLKAQLDKEETKQKLEDLLKRHLEVEGTRKQLTETTVKALFADGKFSDVLFDSLEKHDDKDSANFEERLISLYLVAALSSAEKRKGFGEKLMRIGVNPKEHVEVRKTALELYRPTGSFPQDREDLSYLLAKLLENRKIENKKADGFMLYRVEDAYSIFVSRFSDEHASHLMSWLERNALDEPTSAALLAGLLQMRPKDENREHVGLALLIDSLENKTRRNLSILGLKELGNPKIGLDGRPRRIELSTKSRHAALRALLPRFADTPELFPTAITGTLQYPVLTQLLHSEDHDFLDQEVFSLQDGPGARAVQIILFHWIDLMIKDNRPIPNKLLDKTYSLGDALYQEGSSKVIAHSISAGDLPQIEKFFERLPRLYQGPKKSDASFQGINALRAAIVKDAAHGFKNTLSLLEALKDHPNKKDLIDDVKKQLTTHFVNQRLQQLDLPVIRDDLKPKKGADAFEAYFVPLSHAYADRAKFKMGKAAYTDARADLLQALDINPEHFEFRELLGDLLLKRKGLADAEVERLSMRIRMRSSSISARTETFVRACTTSSVLPGYAIARCRKKPSRRLARRRNSTS
jgi:hypothetical protein